MRRTNALRDTLHDLSAIFNDGEALPVDFDKSSYITPTGTVYVATNIRETIGRDVSGPDELRLIVDSLSHEVEHYRESDLNAKNDFSADETEYPQAAGTIWNIVEDQYIDWSRGERFKGTRRSRAFKVRTIMENDSRRPRIDLLPREQALIEGFLQVAFAGDAKGIQNVDADIQAFLAWARREVRHARRNPDQDERSRIARTIADRMFTLFPPRSEIDLSAFEDLLSELPTDDVDDDVDLVASVDPGEADAQPDLDDRDADDRDADAQPDLDDFAFDPDDLAEADTDGLRTELPDDLAAELDAMNGDPTATTDWHDLDPDDDLAADRADIQRYENVTKKIGEYKSDFGQRRSNRDDRIDANRDTMKSWQFASYIRERMRDSGLAHDIAAAFRQFKTRDFPMPSDAGTELDIDGVIRHMAGDYDEDELYTNYPTIETGGRAIAATVDMSGSMDEIEAKRALAALWIATTQIGDDFVASAFSEHVRHITTPLITGPDESFDWAHLDAITSGGSTPTAAGIVDATSLVREMTARERVIICITDGRANVACRDGNTSSARDDMRSLDARNPTAQAAEAVRRARLDGIKVIGLGAGSGIRDSDMANIFGADGYVMTEMADLTETLVDVYRRQLSVTD